MSRKLEKHFRRCWFLRLIEEANTVVACIPSKSTLPTFSHPEFAGRSQRLWKDFEFDRIFGDDEQFTIVNNKN